MTTCHTRIDTQIGELTLVTDGSALTGLYFPQHWYLPPAAELGPEVDATSQQVFAQAGRQLEEFFAGARQTFDLPIATHGNAFAEQVWALLNLIPYGQTTTYASLAEELGSRTLAQQVGQAVGHNPISIIIPCHRVVGADGKLTGYAGGLQRKHFLLQLQEPVGADTGRLF